ncbi:Bacteriophage CI repressor helix-turn-helix domain-containing protein [Candidatus Electrothrix marina]|uniref:Bacteriophage CI repressor helix-turn-helix domain-containing protein n=1 Tax=Candidatus Electrothrix marina TaxID=1859130 RepID=A0A444JCT0_9BACT|nr:Bacteriophage CI repressor helix-turn-helix domain-containing protein [Candidatus Electrothrix marina]
MSTRKNIKKYKNNFAAAWGRIKKETNISNFNELAEVIGKTQPSISARKKAGDFPIEWAYLVAKEYSLSTEWILTGEGSKFPSIREEKDGYPVSIVEEKQKNEVSEPTEKYEEILPSEEERDRFLDLLRAWLLELEHVDPKRIYWFECAFEDSFPEFKEWKKTLGE